MSHQTYFESLANGVQTEMLAEFSGKDGAKVPLVEVKQHTSPLPGQIEMKEVEG